MWGSTQQEQWRKECSTVQCEAFLHRAHMSAISPDCSSHGCLGSLHCGPHQRSSCFSVDRQKKKKTRTVCYTVKKKYFFEIVNKSWLEKKILIQFFDYKIAHLIQSYLLFLCYCLWNELAISECRLFIHQIVFIVVQNVKMESVK